MRKPIIAGNWKMNKTPEEAKRLINALFRSSGARRMWMWSYARRSCASRLRRKR